MLGGFNLDTGLSKFAGSTTGILRLIMMVAYMVGIVMAIMAMQKITTIGEGQFTWGAFFGTFGISMFIIAIGVAADMFSSTIGIPTNGGGSLLAANTASSGGLSAGAKMGLLGLLKIMGIASIFSGLMAWHGYFSGGHSGARELGAATIKILAGSALWQPVYTMSVITNSFGLQLPI